MGNIIKKIFSSFVALTTIAWSVGFGALAMPTAASAAMAGDLIKASGPAVYYFAADGKRYVFPNEKSYFSWFMDFSGVRTISDTELASIFIGGNVTIRPGTKLVKIQTDPKVYAVTLGGNLHWVESEAVATSLYGANWAQRVVDVPDSFFVNYTIGSAVSTPVHPDSSVITYAGDTTRYVVSNGMKRRIVSDAVFASNGFNPMYVLTTSIVYPNGTDITTRECALADVIAICGAGPIVTGSVTVSLASDTPASATVPKNAASVSLAKYNITAGSAEARIDGLQIRRIGVGSTSDFSNVYLYDGNGNRLTTGRTINSTTNVAEFNGLNITIAAGQTKSIVVVGDFSGASATAGGQHSFEITTGGAVVMVGTGTVGGSYPVRGNVFTVGTISAGRLDVQKGTTPTNPNIGSTNAEISNFKLTANTNDIEVRRITLIQAGSVSNSDLSNFNLYQGTTLVASAGATEGDKIVLNFNPPYVITNGTTKTFSLQAKIAGRSGRTIKTYTEYTTDVYAVDRLYNAGAAVCIAATATGGCTAASQGSFDGATSGTNYIEVTTQGGQLTVAFNGPVTGNVAKGNQDVELYRFSLTSPDNTLEIRNIDFHIQGNTASDLVIGSLGTDYFRDIKIKDLDTGTTWMGPTSFPSTCADGATGSAATCLITLTDSRNINAGQTLNLVITADLYNGAEDAANEFYLDGNNQYKAILGDATALFGSSDVRVVSTGEFLDVTKIVPNTPITGNLQTVKSSNLSVALAASPSAGTAVKKQTLFPVAGFVFTAGDQSDISIRTVKLTGQGSLNGISYGVTTTAAVVTSCALFDGDLQVGLSQSPDTTAGTMNITSMNVVVPAGTSKTLVAKCTADSTVEGAADYVAVGILTASTDVTAEDVEANSVTPTLTAQVVANSTAGSAVLVQTVRSAGTLTVSPDGLRQSTILVGDGGAVWQNFAQFKATAQYEAVTLDKITVTSTAISASFAPGASIAIAQDGAVKGTATLPNGTNQQVDVDLTGSPIVVAKDGSATFQIWGKLANVVASGTVSGSANAARSGNLMALGLAAGITTGDWNTSYAGSLNVRANGAASGDRVIAATTTATNTGNTFVLRKTKPVVTRQALSSTTLTAGLDTDLYKFQVAADSAGSVAVKKVVFNWSKGDTNSSLRFQNLRLRKGSSDIADGDIEITSATSTDYYASGAPALGEASGKIVIEFTNEETVSGSGTVYTLHGTIDGTVDSGDSLSFNFFRDATSPVVTGYLSVDALGTMRGSNIDTGAAPDGISNATGTFVWSDNSEVPHSYASSSAGGSRDWTNDTYVEDLTQQSTLSR